MFKKRFLLLAILLWASTTVSADILLGVHPFRDATEIIRKFSPLGEYLSKQLGEEVLIKVGGSYEAHLNTIGAGSVDIAFVGPALYVTLIERYGQRPLLARLEVNGEPTFFGDIVVADDSPIQTLQDIKGRSFAFGDKNSTMSHIIPRHLLHKAGVDREDLLNFVHLRSHDDVALSVLMGNTDVGAVKHAVFEHYASRGLRSLVSTPLFSEHLFVTRDDMPDSQVDRIRQALLQLTETSVLKPLNKGATALVEVNDSDYDNLRETLRWIETVR